MKRSFMIAIAVTLIVFSSNAQARQFNGNGQPACLTENLLDQIIDAAVSRNTAGIEYLLNNGCVVPRSGIQVSVIDTKILRGKVKVRAFIGGQPVELWTTIEALSR
ncbi:hypothetical protein [Halomonas campaniensis]|uniref:Uncharacterized protein n=1 Tax=Halomonas campaniensis TaxID=213554 RepID=A0A246S473_9GAMM|nr:hypothetical protein [Halomonas campaniensis]OWV31256.1 hypothetical protein JI62_01150 [Halomonas campaniensis]